MGGILTKRVYDGADDGDGVRVLVDRLWPRGVRKEAACLDEWCKGVAPSADLRTWFGHREERFDEFAAAYRHELDASEDAAAFVARCRAWLSQGNVTLLYAARSTTCNHAAVLRQWVAERLRDGS